MSLSPYAIHIASPTSPAYLSAKRIGAARAAVFDARIAYAKSKGAKGVSHTESGVSGLLFDESVKLPDGWALSFRHEDGIVAGPKAKDRTKAAREQVKAIRAEMAALPCMPGATTFTKDIGGNEVITQDAETGRFAMRACYYEWAGETLFVMTPWHHPKDMTGELHEDELATEKNRVAYLPEGCERVPMSTYYLAKEKAAAAKAEKAAA